MKLNLKGKSMEYIYSVEEAKKKLYDGLAEATGWKYLKSQDCLKKTVKDLVFQIDFYASKWNVSHQSVEVNAEFKLWCKSYGKFCGANSIVARVSYAPDGSYWYDISTEKKLERAFQDLSRKIQDTAVRLCAEFEKDERAAAESLLREHFDEYDVYLDFLADKLGMEAIEEKVRQIYEGLSAQMKQEVSDYKNGARDKAWMINRGNVKFVADHDPDL